MKQEEVIEKFSRKDSTPFIYQIDGEVYTTEEAKSNIDQIGTMLYQTLETLGIESIDLIEIAGKELSVVMKISTERIIGSIASSKIKREDVANQLAEMEKNLVTVEVGEEPVVDLGSLAEKINVILIEFLGDFASRVYNNQLKVLNVKEEEVPLKRAKELIYALGNAAELMIGPTQSQEMTDRLLLLLK